MIINEMNNEVFENVPVAEVEESKEFKPLNMVTMYISCRNLVNLDLTSLTDPLVKVYVREEKFPTWTFLGATET